MSFDFRRPAETVAVVEVGERIDVRNADVIGATCAEAVRDGVHRFIFDLRKTTLIDSEGIGMLISLRRRMSRREGSDGEIVLSDVGSEARTTFELTRTERLFTFADDFEKVLDGLGESTS